MSSHRKVINGMEYSVFHVNSYTDFVEIIHTRLPLVFKSYSYITADSQSASLSANHTFGAQDHIFLTVRQFPVCWCGAPSLTRERVYHLQLLLVLASAVILGSESRGTHDHVLLSQIQDSPNPEGQVPVFIFPRNRVPSYTPRHWVPFSSPPTTRGATVEVFDPAPTRL
jgi:hypothetical protein